MTEKASFTQTMTVDLEEKALIDTAFEAAHKAEEKGFDGPKTVGACAELAEVLRRYVETIHWPFTTDFNHKDAVRHWEREKTKGNGLAEYHLAELALLSRITKGEAS